jgi:Uma2 family endonuclease
MPRGSAHAWRFGYRCPRVGQRGRTVYATDVAEPYVAPIVSFAEYLVAELASPTKHEFLDGEVFAMAGGSPEHAALAASVSGQLGAALRGQACRVYSSDLRIRIEETNVVFYPDVSVVCGTLETSSLDPDAATNPVVIVEISSPTTEAFDRGAKAAHYRRLPSLREYVLVAQDRRHVEVHSRNAAGIWEIHEAGDGMATSVALPSLGIALDVGAIYDDPLAPPVA